MQLVPLRDVGSLLDEFTLFLMPWLKSNPDRLRAVIEVRPMRSIEWCLYHGEPVTPLQVEERVQQLRQSKKNLSGDEKFILRWLEKNLTYMKFRAEAYEDPKFNL